MVLFLGESPQESRYLTLNHHDPFRADRNILIHGYPFPGMDGGTEGIETSSTPMILGPSDKDRHLNCYQEMRGWIVGKTKTLPL